MCNLPSTMMHAALFTRPMLFEATRQYCPSSSGKTRGMDRVARLPSKCCRWSVDLSWRIFPSFSQKTIGSGSPSTWHSNVIASPSQQRKSFKCFATRGSVSTFLLMAFQLIRVQSLWKVSDSSLVTEKPRKSFPLCSLFVGGEKF